MSVASQKLLRAYDPAVAVDALRPDRSSVADAHRVRLRRADDRDLPPEAASDFDEFADASFLASETDPDEAELAAADPGEADPSGAVVLPDPVADPFTVASVESVPDSSAVRPVAASELAVPADLPARESAPRLALPRDVAEDEERVDLRVPLRVREPRDVPLEPTDSSSASDPDRDVLRPRSVRDCDARRARPDSDRDVDSDGGRVDDVVAAVESVPVDGSSTAQSDASPWASTYES
ncbi:hypothetical protein [Halosimplex amylolyticum]|uniref:hypothetical protein n=1 Tax=Halosimplex amylolyticum TaxID=3396616 RepID=UPI003F54D861